MDVNEADEITDLVAWMGHGQVRPRLRSGAISSKKLCVVPPKQKPVNSIDTYETL
jgi:hypothetical protein